MSLCPSRSVFGCSPRNGINLDEGSLVQPRAIFQSEPSFIIYIENECMDPKQVTRGCDSQIADDHMHLMVPVKVDADL